MIRSMLHLHLFDTLRMFARDLVLALMIAALVVLGLALVHARAGIEPGHPCVCVVVEQRCERPPEPRNFTTSPTSGLFVDTYVDKLDPMFLSSGAKIPACENASSSQ